MEGFKRIYKTKANVSIPAHMALIVATIGLMSIPISVAADREKRVLLRLQATHVRPQAILIAWVVVYFLVALVGAVLLVVSGKVVCGLRFEGNPLSVFPAFVLSTLSLAAFGFAIASLAQTGRAADIIGIVLFFSMVFLSGATIPWQELPEGVRMMGHALPLTYVVRLLQGLWFAGAWSGHLINVAAVAGTLIIGVVISGETFKWEWSGPACRSSRLGLSLGPSNFRSARLYSCFRTYPLPWGYRETLRLQRRSGRARCA